MVKKIVGVENMYNYDDLIGFLKIDNNSVNRSHIKSIINSLLKNKEAFIEKQRICVDTEKVVYLWNLLDSLSEFFDYKYNTKVELSEFLYFILNGKQINLNAIFCPGYTANGYKDYIGKNNTTRLKILKDLKYRLESEQIKTKFNITLADIFLENTNLESNINLYDELASHREKFSAKAKEYFSEDEIILLSNKFQDNNYIEGFVDSSLLHGKTYHNFYENNMSFYSKMGWSEEETKIRNDRLFTIYSIISKYIYNQDNGIYLPMETMYSRSKVMTNNKVCTMYLHK